jgi:DNA-binding response OmpR family regulator
MGAVLIVDDSAADRALLRTILGRAGYTVYEVAKGGDAVQKTREIRPHVVILDVNLPDLNGLAVCRAIRADADIGGVPVLMLTIRDDDTDVLAGLEAGADDYVAKDSAGAIVVGRVRRLIQFRQMSSMAMLNQQLVQVGRLLAGIVHEIRGPVAKTFSGSMRSCATLSCFNCGSIIWYRRSAIAPRRQKMSSCRSFYKKRFNCS